MKEIILNLKEKSIEILEKFAKGLDLSMEKLCEMILDAWTAFGGQVWSGEYRDARGFIIDWPVKRDVIKIETE